MELFAKQEAQKYFANRTHDMCDSIARMSDEKILGADIDEWVLYYFDSYKLQPITVYLDNATPNLDETTIEQNNMFYSRNDPYEPRTYKIPGYKITFDIPFEGERDLFFLKPSRWIMLRFDVDSIIGSSGEELGKIIFVQKFFKQDMSNISEDFVSNALSAGFKNHLEMINNVNTEVNHYNSHLQESVKKALEARKSKSIDFVKIGELLKIPLKLYPNAPSTIPVPLKKVIQSKPKMPTIRTQENAYTISEEDYIKIKQIVSLAGTSMEKTARTYSKFEEEELRDVIISHLNTHYQGTATGETFNRIGKTDIHIPLENKSAFIAECKIWHGEKQLQSALNQLFSYTTWRDVRTSLIIFNKQNRNFKSILGTIQAFLDNCQICRNKQSLNTNEWQCKFIKSADSTEIVDVHIIIFDLYMDI